MGGSSSRFSNCWASFRHGLDQVVNLSRGWGGHPYLLECLEQLTHISVQGQSEVLLVLMLKSWR